MAGGEMMNDLTLLAAVVQDAPVPLWVIDEKGLLSLANDSAARFLGHRRGADLQGGPSHDLLHRHRPDGSPYPSHECPIISLGSAKASAEWFVTLAGDVREVCWTTKPVGTSGHVLLTFAQPHRRHHETMNSHRPLVRQMSTAGSHTRLHRELSQVIDERFVDPSFSTASLADAAHLSVRSVQVIFAARGRSPAAEIRRRRLDHARYLLERGMTVQMACHESGFLDASTFARAYRQHFGFPPSRTLRVNELPSPPLSG
jgi:AraC-like DNA-binding protein